MLNYTLYEAIGLALYGAFNFKLLETGVKFGMRMDVPIRKALAALMLSLAVTTIISFVYIFFMRPLFAPEVPYYEVEYRFPEYYRVSIFFSSLGLAISLAITIRMISQREILLAIVIPPLINMAAAVFLPIDLIRVVGYFTAPLIIILPLMFIYVGLKTRGLVRKRAFIVSIGILTFLVGQSLGTKLVRNLFGSGVSDLFVFILVPLVSLISVYIIDFGYALSESS